MFIFIAFLLERIANALKDAEFQEKETMIQAWHEHERIEKANKERTLERNLGYQRDLDMQIDYQAHLRQKEKDEDKEEFLLGQVRLYGPVELIFFSAS
jgi:hypothetical protein